MTPGRSGDALREPTGVDVVVGHPVDHAVGSVAQRDQPGRGKDANLAHAAADHLARPSGAPDELGRANDDRPDRAGEALREAEAWPSRPRQQLADRRPERH